MEIPTIATVCPTVADRETCFLLRNQIVHDANLRSDPGVAWGRIDVNHESPLRA